MGAPPCPALPRLAPPCPALPPPCHHLATTLPPPCHHLATTLSPPCHHLATTLPSPCHHLATTLPPPCHHLATTLPPPCHHPPPTLTSRFNLTLLLKHSYGAAFLNAKPFSISLKHIFYAEKETPNLNVKTLLWCRILNAKPSGLPTMS